MARRLAALAIVLLAGPAVRAAGSEPMPFPGKPSAWHGYARHDFACDGRKAIVVAPKQAAAGRPWIWRARFFGHEPQTDLALLARGFHLAYIDVAGLFGSPKAVAHWDAFYTHLTREHGFAERVALEGMSRGGLIVLNWAIAHPERVACIYVDAPVCDFKSWPGGKGKGRGAPAEWRRCQAAYGFQSEADALAYQGNPIDALEPLAKAKVPIFSICGAADVVVPIAENTAVLETRYRALGGPIDVVLKPGCGHHPHSLGDPARIVAFVLKHTTGE